MILASLIFNYISFIEIFGERTIIFAGLLMIWLLTEKLEDQMAPLAIFPALFWVALSSPRLLSKISRFDYPEGFRVAMILLPGLALLGLYLIWLKKEIHRHRRFFAYGFLGVLPMILAIHNFWGLLFQAAFSALVLHQCLRHGSTPDFKVRLVRSCTRLILIVLPLTWLVSVGELYHCLDTMTGAGKNAMLVISFVGLLNHITLELLLLLPLLIWLLSQDRLRLTQKPGEPHADSCSGA